jgi:hypothetical protein
MSGEQYRVRATEFHEQAKNEPRQTVRDELERLALSYLRLAEQADQNELVDLVYETPPTKPQPNVQQQQQIQPGKKPEE